MEIRATSGAHDAGAPEVVHGLPVDVLLPDELKHLRLGEPERLIDHQVAGNTGRGRPSS